MGEGPARQRENGRHRMTATGNRTPNRTQCTLLTVTDVAGLEHLVTDEALAAGRRAGRYIAVCKSEVIAASLTTPETGHCEGCRQRRAGQ